ncbi:hypothetical protein CEUSTIGMA_g5136.t1 [Chlamydomonas eustigma]|uniref:EF-hand domain-containing protein n=1 Tax=Chlamydomonas eustigma TaxID=1157962 RepID=A0A250X3N5_9CHLO|nr:hypothetical protein CEUSTIGMA_g5136.t1 [Chlamydomonas eustigma]|eukprot:GAX77693.1 hypothetical protein CEUSTIGMA_g5136.t1 [Chlamydomonas eustigma]
MQFLSSSGVIGDIRHMTQTLPNGSLTCAHTTSRVVLRGSGGGLKGRGGWGGGRGGGGGGSVGGTRESDDGDVGGAVDGSWLALGCALSFLGTPNIVFAAKEKAPDKSTIIMDTPSSSELSIDSVADMLWRVAGPMITNLGFSGGIGLVSGMAFKKVGQLLAIFIGLSFITLQGLAQTGFITVNWTGVEQYVTKTLDSNNDGKLDELDFKKFVNHGLGVLSAGVPSIGGFLAGFLLGLKM